MEPDRKIGRVVKVKTYQALVELTPDTSSYVKSSYGGVYSIAAVNSYVIVPIGSERIVAIVTGLDMIEEAETRVLGRPMLVLPNPRRTMWVSLIGTISQIQGDARKRFEYGIRHYPELDNPVWFATEEDLDVIFEGGKCGGLRDDQLVSIGTSPLFPRYNVWIDMDRFFGKHAAVLGSTGSGKSCTVTALIRAVLDKRGEKGMPHAHFIIFDTNAEYKSAFTLAGNAGEIKATPLYERLVITNDGDEPTGFWLPHWFMNGRDYAAFFRPGEGAQAPLLHQAIGTARAGAQLKSNQLRLHAVMETAIGMVEDIAQHPPMNKSRFRGKPDVKEQVQGLKVVLERYKPTLVEGGLVDSLAVYEGALAELEQAASYEGQFAPNPTADFFDKCLEQVGVMRRQLELDRTATPENDLEPVGIDTPAFFDFEYFVRTTVREVVQRESSANPNIRAYAATLLVRLEEALQDPRYAFIFRISSFDAALGSFLRLVFGVQPSRNFQRARPPWASSYESEHPRLPPQHQVTILDLSRLASDVLENVTALLGRLILEFMQRCPDRGRYPVVLVLEEAHRYIPAMAPLERQQRAREVFERIAKEGRKYGLGLVVASQRPSELSRTVVSQCNSFIIHRIQNPDDREYFKSVIPDINRDLLDQLPALPQQHALVIGDCIKIPMQVRINDVDPKPHSHDPEFFKAWSNPAAVPPDFEAICSKWEGSVEVNVGPGEVTTPTASGEVGGEVAEASTSDDENDFEVFGGGVDEVPAWLEDEMAVLSSQEPSDLEPDEASDTSLEPPEWGWDEELIPPEDQVDDDLLF